MRSRSMRLLLLGMVASIILVFSLLSKPPIHLTFFAGEDKVKHWFAYSLLGLLSYLTLKSPAAGKLLTLLLSVAACTCYGGIIELLQSFTGRDPDIYDLLADLLGACTGSIGALGFLAASTKRRRRGG